MYYVTDVIGAMILGLLIGMLLSAGITKIVYEKKIYKYAEEKRYYRLDDTTRLRIEIVKEDEKFGDKQ
jgi:deoxycytidylate deaminase